MFMPMQTRIDLSIAFVAVASLIPIIVHAKDPCIFMLDAAPDDAQHTKVFAPDIQHIEPGDTVTSVSTDSGHNTASKRGMVPDGAEPWNSPNDEDFSVTLTVPRVYGYVCLPHYELGWLG